MRIATIALAALLATAPPAVGQDLFQSFEDFVEEMLPPRRAPRQPVDAVQPTPSAERPAASGEETDAEEEEAPPPPLPRPRPEDIEAVPDPVEAAEGATAEPGRIYQSACPALLAGQVLGEMLPPVEDGVCTARSPLSISAVKANGREIALSTPVTTNCAMAGALADWIGEVDAYAGAAMGSPIATVSTGTSLMCRNRNGAEDGFVSEHGFANALDVVGFTLDNGETIVVEADWLPAAAPAGRLLRQAHGAACGRFTTVLGPEANAEHSDHLHLDLGCHGQSCLARICE